MFVYFKYPQISLLFELNFETVRLWVSFQMNGYIQEEEAPPLLSKQNLVEELACGSTQLAAMSANFAMNGRP